MDLDTLANDIRRAGGISHIAPVKPPQVTDPKKGTRATPDLGRLHIAFKEGHITKEEAEDLNPKYGKASLRTLGKHATKIRKLEKDPELVARQRKARYEKRKAVVK